MKDIIVNIALYSVEMLIMYMYASSLFEKKRKTFSILLYSEILYLAISVFNIILGNIIINIASFMVINFIVLILNYNITIRQSVIHTVILTAIMLITECIVAFPTSAFLNVDLLLYKEQFTLMLIESSLSKMLYIALCFILTKTNKTEKYNRTKIPLYLFLFPLCSIFVLVLLICIAANYDLSVTINNAIAFLSVVLLLSVVLTYIMYNNFSKKEKELYELKNEFSKIETDKSYYQILERQNEEIHSFSHNAKNHFQVIKSLTNEKIVENYIDNCYEKLEKYSMFGKTNNKILDIIINKYSLLCEIKNIDFFVSIKTANLAYIKDDDLSTLLNCILDNAVEAAETTQNGRIELNLNNQNFFDVLTCINSCNYNSNFDKNTLKTTKENADMHGYGTKSIKKIVKNNKGTYSWKYDKENSEFITTIIFKKES